MPVGSASPERHLTTIVAVWPIAMTTSGASTPEWAQWRGPFNTTSTCESRTELFSIGQFQQ
jgi:hypothetical protein